MKLLRALLSVVLLLVLAGGIPTTVAAAESSTRPISDRLGLGSGNGCVIDVQGKVYCWGWNAQGTAGGGFYSETYEPLTLVPVPKSVKVVVGFGNSCAITESGDVYCWGYDMGINGDNPILVPKKIDELSNVVDIATSLFSVCAIRSDTSVWCWGKSLTIGGQFVEWPTKPTKMQEFGSASKIFSGTRSICVQKADLDVTCMGHFSGMPQPTLPTPTRIPEVSGALSLSAGGGAVCGLFAGGSIKCWGANHYGQLGLGNLDTSITSSELKGVPSFVGLSTQAFQTCAWTALGEIWCWGYGWNASEPNPTPRLTKVIPDIDTVRSGLGIFECFLTRAGEFNCNAAASPEYQVRNPDFSGVNGQVVTFASPSPDQLRVTWAERLASQPVENYKVEYSVYGVGSWKSIPMVAPGDKSALITGLRPATTYSVRVTPVVAGIEQPASIFTGYTSGLGTFAVQVLDQKNMPIRGGKLSWITDDGKAKSAKPLSGTDLGNVTFNSVPGKPLRLSVVDAETQDGYKVSGTFSVRPINEFSKVSLPAVNPPRKIYASVKMPNGTPVPGADVQVRGFELQMSVSTENFIGSLSSPSMDSAKTNVSGLVSFEGWPGTKPELRAIYDDGELSQSTDWQGALLGETSALTLDYMPVLEASASSSPATLNTLISISVSVSQTFQSTNFRRMSRVVTVEPMSVAGFSGLPVEVVAPQGSNQSKCKGKTSLKSKLDSKGQAKLTVCANASGVYSMKTKGAISLGGVFIRVKNSQPTAPQALSVSAQNNTASISWQEPRFAGGVKVSSYRVTATAKGQVPRVVTVPHTSSTASAVIRNLDGNQSWSFSVSAINKFGVSPSASVVQIVEGMVYSSMIKVGKPTIKGVAKAGVELTVNPGSWDKGVAIKYQWLRNGVEIQGATKSKYLVKSSDSKAQIKVRVEASKPGYRMTQSETPVVKVR